MLGIDPGQKRIRIGTKLFSPRPIGRILLRRRAERDERSIDIEKQQRKLHRASHDSTIATVPTRAASVTTALQPTTAPPAGSDEITNQLVIHAAISREHPRPPRFTTAAQANRQSLLLEVNKAEREDAASHGHEWVSGSGAVLFDQLVGGGEEHAGEEEPAARLEECLQTVG